MCDVWWLTQGGNQTRSLPSLEIPDQEVRDPWSLWKFPGVTGCLWISLGGTTWRNVWLRNTTILDGISQGRGLASLQINWNTALRELLKMGTRDVASLKKEVEIPSVSGRTKERSHSHKYNKVGLDCTFKVSGLDLPLSAGCKFKHAIFTCTHNIGPRTEPWDAPRLKCAEGWVENRTTQGNPRQLPVVSRVR